MSDKPKLTRYQKRGLEFKRPEPIIDTSDQMKVRGCLKCSKSFQSRGHHNRICTPCKELASWNDETRTYSIITNKN